MVATFVSLDGVMQAPGGPDEDPTGGFQHGGWVAPFFDDALMQYLMDSMSVPFDLLLGRRTYEIFAAHWPYANDPMAEILNRATKHVASNSLRELGWSNSHLITGDVAAEVGRLKALAGPGIQVHGSSQLIQTLLAHHLIDEFQLKILPLILGKGKRLFADGARPTGLTRVASRSSTTGVTMNTYRWAGAPQTGSFAPEHPTDAEIERRRKLTREG
jgi:dihydrofolate reductase